MRFRSIKSVFDTFSTLVVIVVAGVVLFKTLGRTSGPEPPIKPPIEDVRDLTVDADRLAHVRGSGDLVLVEFSDYECPFCARHARDTGPAIKKLIDSGKLRHVVFNFPLRVHPNAKAAGEAAECAAKQGRFWEMHDQLFADSSPLTTPGLMKRGERVGLVMDLFEECLLQGQTTDRIEADLELGQQLGVAATPAFFVGRGSEGGSISLVKRINGARPFDIFEEAFRNVSVIKRVSR